MTLDSIRNSCDVLPLNHALCIKILRIWDSNYFVETCTVRGIELMRHDEYPRWPDILYVTVHESSCGHLMLWAVIMLHCIWWFAVQVSVKRKSWRDTAARTFTIHRAGNVMQIEMLSKFITPLCLVNIVTVVSCSTDFSQKLPIFSLKKSNPESMGLIETDWGWEVLTAHRLWAHSSQGRRHPEGA